MKTTLVIFSLSLTLSGFAQQSKSERDVKTAVLNYIEGFYEGDSVKLKKCLSHSLVKYGYWKDKKSGNFDGESMSYQQAIAYAKETLAKKEFATAGSPKEIVVLDVQEFVACAKVKAWWGIDYVLLSKHSGSWMIDQVLWQGPLNTIVK